MAYISIADFDYMNAVDREKCTECKHLDKDFNLDGQWVSICQNPESPFYGTDFVRNHCQSDVTYPGCKKFEQIEF